jgi:D-cysteine desulfhydrase
MQPAGSPPDHLAPFERLPRASLATLPTPLEPSAALPGGASLLVKRDDLTGLGMGGNKARKLEFLCGAALADGADVLVTAGGPQSNHCRMTAAAGARLGLDVHLVLGGAEPVEPSGNQLLALLFGAQLHFVGSHDWADIEHARRMLTERLAAEGRRPATIPIGGSTPTGSAGFALAYLELAGQLAASSVIAAAVVHTSSSGGTHAGLLAGQVLARSAGLPSPRVVAVAVAKGVVLDESTVMRMADATLDLLGEPGSVAAADVEALGGWLGPGYEVPTQEGDDAVRWFARKAGLVLDRTYTGKGA